MESFNSKNKPPEPKPKDFWRIREWFPEIDAHIETKLKIYNSELLKFNPSLNLVSEKTLSMSDALHFSDSILGAKEIMKDCKSNSIFDIGFGNGFPGIIIGLLYSNVHVTFVERDPRKVEFLKQISKQLEMSNVEVKSMNLEAIPVGSLDTVVMRGFLPIAKALLVLRKQFKRGGNLYFMKGEEWASEVVNIPSQLCSFWRPSLVGEYRLPVGEVKFAVVKLSKIAD